MHNVVVHNMDALQMAITFKEGWPEAFYERNTHHRQIPPDLRSTLFRKLQLLDAAHREADLRLPPGNRVEHLTGTLQGWCSIRINKQYRLIFQWCDGVAEHTWLDAHRY